MYFQSYLVFKSTGRCISCIDVCICDFCGYVCSAVEPCWWSYWNVSRTAQVGWCHCCCWSQGNGHRL